MWYLEELHASLQLVAPPLGQPVELGPGALQDVLELNVRQVTLQRKTLSKNSNKLERNLRNQTHLQVAAINV